MFEVLTGEPVEKYPTVRDVEIQTKIRDGVTDKNVAFSVSVSGPESVETTAYNSGECTLSELPPGEYSIAADVSEVYEYDMETVERTEYVVESATVSLSSDTVVIDATQTPIGTTVSGPTVTLDKLTLNGVKE
jgi:hypothetical protein